MAGADINESANGNVFSFLNYFKNYENLWLTFPEKCIILTYVIEAWLSLVERCVRDAEAACSNHVASIYLRPDGQAAKTTPSHGVNPGSIPGQVI